MNAAPCSDPTNCLMQLGAVVRKIGDPSVRGVVEESHKRGHVPIVSSGLPRYPEDAVVRKDSGQWHITNVHDKSEWELVPDDEQTAVERLRSAALTWEPASDTPEDYEADSPVFAWIRALLTPAEQEEVFNDFSYCWPTSCWELLLRVATTLDERTDAPPVGVGAGQLENGLA